MLRIDMARGISLLPVPARATVDTIGSFRSIRGRGDQSPLGRFIQLVMLSRYLQKAKILWKDDPCMR